MQVIINSVSFELVSVSPATNANTFEVTVIAPAQMLLDAILKRKIYPSQVYKQEEDKYILLVTAAEIEKIF